MNDKKPAPHVPERTAPQAVPPTNPNPKTDETSPESQHRWRSTLATIGILCLAPIIAILLTVYVFQSYQVDGPSMQNTLHNADRLIVWKLPRTWARITGHAYIPKRGDIVIFNETGLANYGDTSNTKQLIKRVIGLPGDHLVIKNNKVTIYNKAHPHGFDPDTTLPYGKNGAIPPTAGNVDITLGKDQLYVCGDNRGDSLDSRYFGPIKANQIIGKLVARILPIGGAERF